MSVIGVIGMGWGDEGKGSIVDYLSTKTPSPRIGRFSGGAQALHHVYLPDGRCHGFRLHSSGTLSGATTELNKNVLVDPQVSLEEINKLETFGIPNPGRLLTVDPNCLVITPWHAILSQCRELARKERVGTCGMGIGEIIKEKNLHKWMLRVIDLTNTAENLKNNLFKVFQRIESEGRPIGCILNWNKVEEIIHIFKTWADSVVIDTVDWKNNPPDILEGSQGTLLDPDIGMWPFVTKTNVTADTARKAVYPNKIHIVGVTRSFMTRHGRGPFMTEVPPPDAWTKEEDNQSNEWQSNFRYGRGDLVALKHAILRGGKINSLAITCLDRAPNPLICTEYPKYVNRSPRYIRPASKEKLIELFENELQVPVLIQSSGKTHKDKYESTQNEMV